MQKLLGIKIDNKHSFKTRVEDLCKKASRELVYTLARITQ